MNVTPRGPLSAALLAALPAPLHPQPELSLLAASRVGAVGPHDTVINEDVQLALYLMYELHSGLEGANPSWEWAPDVLAARAVLETAFEADLRRRFRVDVSQRPVAEALVQMAVDASRPGPDHPVTQLATRATSAQVAELLVQRSLHQGKETDPYTRAIPRLRGRAKAALVDIQVDAYGMGRVEQMRSSLFAATLRGLGLDDTPGAYLDVVPTPALAAVNAVSMLSLHHRLLGALCGHLATHEMTSYLMAEAWAEGLRRLGVDEAAVAFFDARMDPDNTHPQTATYMCCTVVEEHAGSSADVLWGASVHLGLEGLVMSRTQRSWAAGRSVLRGSFERNV